jgi:glutamate dehydrogenase/leucine dehydrogenase
MDVTRFVETTGAKVIVEGANHPVTDQAEKYLERHGIFILPDYLINCGGLIGCWADWVYRRELQGGDGEDWHHQLNESVPRYISKIVGENVPRVLAITGNEPQGTRKATKDLARKRRKELAERFQRSTDNDSGGRGFARLCLDTLLN